MTTPLDPAALDALIARLRSGRLSAREWEYLRVPCADALAALRQALLDVRDMTDETEVHAAIDAAIG